MNTLFKSQLLAATASLLLAGAASASQIQTAGTSKLLAQSTVAKAACPSLSTEQLEKLSALKDKFALDTAQDRAQLKVDRHQLFELLSEPKVNKEQVLSLETKMNALKNQISDARINLLLAKSDVLSPDQREKIHDRFLMRSLRGGQQAHKYGGFKGKGCGFGKQSISKRTVSG